MLHSKPQLQTINALSNSALITGLLSNCIQNDNGESSSSMPIATTGGGGLSRKDSSEATTSPLSSSNEHHHPSPSPHDMPASSSSSMRQLKLLMKQEIDDESSSIDAIKQQHLVGSPSTSAGSSLSEDGPLLNEQRAKFEMPIPLPMPRELNINYICETASRLLFLSVHWLKSIKPLNLR
jgi:hypothetical protein